LVRHFSGRASNVGLLSIVLNDLTGLVELFKAARHCGRVPKLGHCSCHVHRRHVSSPERVHTVDATSLGSRLLSLVAVDAVAHTAEREAHTSHF
jgi:hypothetical protein